MAHTYYTRLTIVHPNDVNKLDPRLGIVIAETATTGKFIMTDITWESVINSNAVTTIAMQQKGEIKIKVINVSYYKYEFNLVELLLNTSITPSRGAKTSVPAGIPISTPR